MNTRLHRSMFTVAACAAVAMLFSATRGTLASQAPARAASAAWSPLDSPRVHVWSDRGNEPATGTLPSLRITLDGRVEYRAAAAAPAAARSALPGGYAVEIELKAVRVPPLANPTPYPLAFPRPNGKKVLENERVLVWDYTWTPGTPTPMHFHDKDVVVLYLEDGALRSTEPGGQSVVNPHYFGFTKLNARNRSHTEELIEGKGRAIITELK